MGVTTDQYSVATDLLTQETSKEVEFSGLTVVLCSRPATKY